MLTPTARRRLGLALRLAVIALVVLAFAHFARGLDVRAIGRVIRHADPGLVALAALLNLLQIVPRAFAWSTLLVPVQPVPALRIVRHHAASAAVSNLLAARLGDLARIYLLREHERVPVAASAAVTVIEKALACLLLLAVAAPLPWVVPALPPWMGTTALVLGAVGLATLGALALSPRLLGRVAPLARFVEAARAAQRPGLLLRAFGFMVVEWLLCAACLLLLARALGAPSPWVLAPLAHVLLNVAIVLPTTPGQLGAYEMGAFAAMRLAGADVESAAAYAILLHVVDAVPITLLGLGGLRAVSRVDLDRATEPSA